MKISLLLVAFFILILKINSQNVSNSSVSNNKTNSTNTNTSLTSNSNSPNLQNMTKNETIAFITKMQAQNPATQCILVTNPKSPSDCFTKTRKNYTSQPGNFTLNFYCCYTNWKYNTSNEYSQCVPWYSVPENFETHYTKILQQDQSNTNIKVSCLSVYLGSSILTIILIVALIIKEI
jgi:hypothetical protein